MYKLSNLLKGKVSNCNVPNVNSLPNSLKSIHLGENSIPLPAMLLQQGLIRLDINAPLSDHSLITRNCKSIGCVRASISDMDLLKLQFNSDICVRETFLNLVKDGYKVSIPEDQSPFKPLVTPSIMIKLYTRNPSIHLPENQFLFKKLGFDNDALTYETRSKCNRSIILVTRTHDCAKKIMQLVNLNRVFGTSIYSSYQLQ